MKTFNVQEAKTHLSRLIEQAVAGEDIVIAKAGKPRVRLVACVPDRAPRVLGGWEGRIRIADDFDETPEELIRLFDGDGPARAKRRRR